MTQTGGSINLFSMVKKILFFIFLISGLGFNDNSFKKEQLKFGRVRAAYSEKWSAVKGKLLKAGIDTSHFELFIRAFKREAELEVWARSNKTQYKLVETYAICSSSGELGPKRRQGDGQVPEGFYHLSVFNPTSSYHLSLGINYPNKSDKIIVGDANPGGDIMIHGNCVTIGCMPLTDAKIKEVYIMAVEARGGGQQNIPVHIFPSRLTEEKFTWLKTKAGDGKMMEFWTNLREGYTFFENKKTIPSITVDQSGKYLFK